jgi:predicted ATP-dependent protease
MRQTLDELEEVFREQMAEDRNRAERLRKDAVKRSRQRYRQRERQRSSIRFWLLVLTLIATAVGVTVAMFATLNALLA